MQVVPVCNYVVQRIWRFVNGRVPSCAKGSIAALFCLTTLKATSYLLFQFGESGNLPAASHSSISSRVPTPMNVGSFVATA